MKEIKSKTYFLVKKGKKNFSKKKLYKLQKLLDKEKLIEEKLQQRKLEEEILKKAKMSNNIEIFMKFLILIGKALYIRNWKRTEFLMGCIK